MISKGFVINPYYELLPAYKISPFTNIDLSINRSFPDNDSIDSYFSRRFNKKEYIYTINGRAAINIALRNYNLLPDDVVTILTTSGNYYISGCVTKEIEIFCKWSRVIEPNTKLLFVIHEFGYPYYQLTELKKYNLPIIEDCAHSFFTKDESSSIGTIGDFIIYSFPKMFPTQIGGLLVNNLSFKLPGSTVLKKKEKRYIKNILSHYIQHECEIKEKRLANYTFLSNEFNRIGLAERFKPAKGTIPGVFMFSKENHQFELPELKKHFYAHGIQCSVFYGEETFFIPVHQALNKHDLDYFLEVMKSFIKNSLI